MRGVVQCGLAGTPPPDWNPIFVFDIMCTTRAPFRCCHAPNASSGVHTKFGCGQRLLYRKPKTKEKATKRWALLSPNVTVDDTHLVWFRFMFSSVVHTCVPWAYVKNTNATLMENSSMHLQNQPESKPAKKHYLNQNPRPKLLWNYTSPVTAT